MTPLRRKVSRETTDDAWQGRKLIVTLAPGDVIEVREKGRRKTFSAPIAWVARQIILFNVEAERAEQKTRRRLVRRSLV